MPRTSTEAAGQETVEMLVRIPSELREQVRERATTEERTQAQVIRRALRYYLEQVPA